MKSFVMAVSFVAIPIGFVSLSSLLSRKRIDDKNTDSLDAQLDKVSAHGVNYMFKSLDSAALVLRLGRDIIRTKLLSRADEFFAALDVLERRSLTRIPRGCQRAIVIEGLPSSGVSELVNSLVLHAKGVSKLVPNPSIRILDEVLTELPKSIQSAYRCVCNYSDAYDAADNTEEEYVLIERNYHAACAQSISDSDVPVSEFTSLPPSAFQWPIDLPQPAMAMYLAVQSEERFRRIGIVDAATKESQLMVETRLQTAYSMVTGPTIIAIDASGSPADVLETALQCLEQQEIFIRAPNNNNTELGCNDDDFTLSLPPVRKNKYGNKRESMGVYGAIAKVHWAS